MYNAYERETLIHMCDADNYATIETYQKKMIRRILKAKQKADKINHLYKEEGVEVSKSNTIKIVKQTEDMLEAIIPVNFIKISPPRYVSSERRAKMSEMGKTHNFGRKPKEETKDDYSENSEYDFDEDYDEDFEIDEDVDEYGDDDFE